MLLCELRGINVTLFYGQPIMLINLIDFKLYIPIHIFYLTSNFIMKSDFKASLSQLLIPEVMGLIPQKLTVPKQLLYFQFSEANIRDIPSLTIPKIGHEKPKT